MDKSIFFLTLCFVCVWLVVDVALGKDYLGNFLGSIFPFMSNSNTTASTMTTTQDTENSADTTKAEWGNK